ncbi:MAG: carboxylating nicotinate-nucleotide diphosphorylase [Candidatus Eremiobacterota bacterium]
MGLYPLHYRESVERALQEDLGHGPDWTTDAILDPDTRGQAELVLRSEGRVCGVEVAAAAFRLLDPEIEVKVLHADGEDAGPGPVMLVAGRARALLTAERVALNFLGRLSGVATATRAMARAVEGTRAHIVCTRKTTPGLRLLEKYAVRCGGGHNHRFGLDDAVMIKDNHRALAGGLRAAVERVRARVGHMVKVELEVDTLEELREALTLPIDAVLLDNMTPARLREAVQLVGGRLLTEASGGITLETVREVALAGVDLISSGALTHSSPCLDVSMEVLAA